MFKTIRYIMLWPLFVLLMIVFSTGMFIVALITAETFSDFKKTFYNGIEEVLDWYFI